MEKKNKKSKAGIVIWILLLILFLLGGIILGQYLSNKGILNVFEIKQNIVNNNKKDNKNNTEKPKTKNSLRGQKYVNNLSEDKYLEFTNDTEYVLSGDKGTYKYENNQVTLSNKTTAIIENNKLIFNPLETDNSNQRNVYFLSNNIKNEFNLINNAVTNYIKDIPFDNVKEIKEIENDIRYCFYINNDTENLICSINSSYHFDDYSKQSCETDSSYTSYLTGNATCTDNGITSFHFYTLHQDNNTYIAKQAGTSL